MDQIDDFLGRIPAFLDESGTVGEPDLDLIRDLLEARSEVLQLDLPIEEWKIPACFVWPNDFLWRTVLEVGPFKFRYDEGVRDALIRTVPILGGFIRMRCTVEKNSTIRAETDDVVKILRGSTATELETPWLWALRLRRHHGKKQATPDGDAIAYEDLPWERRDELAGPILRAVVELPSRFWETTPPAPVRTLPSSLVADARRAPLMAAMVEVAEFLADRPKVWTGSRLTDEVVRQVLEGTSLTDPDSVQEAWRLAVLTGFLWPTPDRAFRGEKLDRWADPSQVVRLWTEAARVVVRDLPDPLRDEVVRLILAAYHPGIDETSAVLGTVEGHDAVDRLRRMGVLDGFTLSPLGCQGLLFSWTGWKGDGGSLLQPGEWRPDLTAADLSEWLLARVRGLLDPAAADWARTVDPQLLAGQLVDTILAVDDPAMRGIAFNLLAQLGSAVTPALDRLAGTPMHAYRAAWPYNQGAPAPTSDEMKLYLTDYLAFYDECVTAVERGLRPGARAKPGAFDFLAVGENALLDRLRHGAPMTAEDVAELRQLFTESRDDVRRILAQLPSDR